MPQLEGSTTKKYIYTQLCTGGIWREQSRKKKRLATIVSSDANLQKKTKTQLPGVFLNVLFSDYRNVHTHVVTTSILLTRKS